MTTTVYALAACPAWCVRDHQDLPDNSVHDSVHVFVPQVAAPTNPDPMLLYTSQDMERPQVRLYCGDYEFDLAGAERLLAELGLQVQRMREEQARTDAAVLLGGAW